MTNKTELALDYEKVRSFFPIDLPKLFELDEREMDFFGIYHNEDKVHEGNSVVSRSYYLAALVNNQVTTKYSNLSFQGSRNKWISLEDNTFRELRADKRFGSNHLEVKYPLLALWISNWCQPIENPFRFAELLRYADHEQFRRRGIATAVLDQVCERMRLEGTEFVFVNYNWVDWSKQSEVIPAGIPKRIQNEIMGCFPAGYYHEEYDANFVDSRRNGFFKFIDRARNSIEHKRAMRRHKEHCKKLERYFAELRKRD